MYIDKISISYLHENIFIKAERGRTTGKWQAFVWVTCHYSPIYLNLRLGLVAWSHKSRRTDCYSPKLRFIYFLLQLSSSRKSTELLAYTIFNFYTGEWDVTPDGFERGFPDKEVPFFFMIYSLFIVFIFHNWYWVGNKQFYNRIYNHISRDILPSADERWKEVSQSESMTLM